MKLKNKLILLGILTGVISCFGISSAKASEITSVFSEKTINRNTIANLATVSQIDNSVVPITLGIKESEYKTNNGKVYWTIRDTNDQYKDIYCLNLSRGFGAPDGNITNLNSIKNYTSQYNFNTISESDYITYTGLDATSKNKILWIINNSLNSKENIGIILTLASQKVDISSVGLTNKEIENFIKEDMISNTRNSTKLTFEDIKIVQQIAIWHYTNPESIFDNTIGAICNSDGKQISGLMNENIDIDGYGTYIWNGKVKQAKLNALYKYFIDGAESIKSEIKVPTLTLSNTDVTVIEEEESYIVGPFSLLGTNTDLIKEINANINVKATLLDSSKIVVESNDFSKVIENEFYLRVEKDDITENTEITIKLTYKYNEKYLKLLTNRNDANNTQPVVLVEAKEKSLSTNTKATIEIVSVSVEKLWEDNNNQDGKRPTSVKVQLYRNSEKYGDSITLNSSNNWTYSWDKLLDGYTYTVKELNKSENKVEDNQKYDENYTAKYRISGNKTTITNGYTPESTEISITKIWDDNNNQDGKRREYGVTLKANGKPYGKEIILNADTLTYTWKNLPKYENGKEIKYTVEETEIPDEYKVSYSEDTFTITNTYTPGKTSKKVVKVWSDEDNKDELRTSSVTVTLYKTVNSKKTKIETQVLSENNNWMHVWSELDKMENGVDIVYSVEEDAVENYTTTYSSENYKNTDEITITNTHIPAEKKFDLALRKFITKINDETYSREPIVDTSTIETTGTATYKHIKQPIAVQKGDVVTYTIRVYNEGEIDGYVDKITDYIPDHLLPIITGVDGIDEKKYSKEIDFNANWGWINSEDGKSVTTMKTSKVNSDTYSLLEGYENVIDTKLDAYVEDSDKLDYIEVQIKCLVTDKAVNGEYLTNIAEITESQDIDENKKTDIDSVFGNVEHSNLSDYKNDESLKSTTDSYVPGQEDDDDFEKLVVKEFDLSLRKFITKVNEATYSREPKVDTSKLGTIVNGSAITTATYNHSKEPVIVETNDIVTYTIRIYNEGSISGFANEITDNIPEGLEFLPNSETNVSYRWKMIDKDGNETTDATKAVIITTDYLSDRDENNVIKEVTENDGVKTLSYKDVEVQFKVVAKPEKLKDNLIINEAQISADSERDIDSTPNRDEKYDYKTGNNEDDIDYEPIKLQYFDLALRKFITKVNSTDYNNRYPEIKFNDDGSITYNHTKDPVLVATGDTVIYTIRVYNEGEVAGYATGIKDNLPEGLEFDPNNETNKSYGWKMIDKDGNVTEDANKVVAFTTNYLEKEIIDPLIELNGSKILSYKDVQIAFKVIESNKSDRILVNTAEISADSDDDIDSTPNNNVESEDDIDKEYVKVEYFDLSLKKWVTETIVTLDGKTTTTKTGFTPDSEGIAKVDIVASKLKKTTVKFKYNIKVTNEGELPGYAYEVKDYIPSGLKFVADDNKNWKEVKDNVVVTDQLKDTLLNPGESATVEIVLTWKNSSTNLGTKTNYAEISKDSGDDIDSTPDNFNLKEDDIDDAQVILSIKTAGKTTYIGLILISIIVLAGGIYGIKKYVLK